MGEGLKLDCDACNAKVREVYEHLSIVKTGLDGPSKIALKKVNDWCPKPDDAGQAETYNRADALLLPVLLASSVVSLIAAAALTMHWRSRHTIKSQPVLG